jgi:hypothetical protein
MMTPQEMEARIVRYGDLKPCRTAFIDAHTPGSDQKENFTIIGGGVSEAADQHVHITLPHGFNIGAAGPAAEVPQLTAFPPHGGGVLRPLRALAVLLGPLGECREVVLEQGDIFNIPTGIFRGFENIGTDYGMIMAILGGDDAGGGVIWAPQVIEEAQAHGLVLSEEGKLYDTKKGAKLPEGVGPMPVLTDEDLKAFPEPTTQDVIPGYVARYWDLVALADKRPVQVIGADGVLRDRPGFEVEFVTRASAKDTSPCPMTAPAS